MGMPLIDCEINLITWSAKCVISSNPALDQEVKFAITGRKLYCPVVNSST